jgi:hypothetical protein
MRISWEEAVARGFITKAEVPKVAKPETRARNKDREGEEQAELIREFERLYPQYAAYLFAIPNGGSRRNKFEGYRLKAQGVKAGVSDLFLPVPRGGFHGIWLEFKAAPPFDAAVTDSQKEWLAKMKGQGYDAHLAKGVAAALEVLAHYLQKAPTRVITAQNAQIEQIA